MEILSRNEFKDAMGMIFQSEKLGGDHPIWIPEKEFEPEVKCIKFLRTKPIKRWETTKEDYWAWCNEVLHGEARCFSSGDEDEWWGFTDPDDIVIWTLKWAK